jgi:hypothetical protein
MVQIIVLGLVGVTSVAACLASVKWLGLSGHGLQAALARTLEMIGTAAVFFAVNLTLGVTAILAVRSLTNVFVSVYLIDDVSLLLLSALQGVIFATWRHTVEARNRSQASPRV